MNIKEALQKLDHKNDDHWTSDGQPKLDVLKGWVGDAEEVTRKAVIDADPKFRREETAEQKEAKAPKADLMPKIEELTKLYQEKIRAKGKIEEELKELAFEIEQLSIKHERQTYRKPGEKLQSQINTYLERQRQVREEKAAARKRFAEAMGQNPGDILADLDTRSTLDKAMSSKKRKQSRA